MGAPPANNLPIGALQDAEAGAPRACPGFRRWMVSFTLVRRYAANHREHAMIDRTRPNEPATIEGGP